MVQGAGLPLHAPAQPSARRPALLLREARKELEELLTEPLRSSDAWSGGGCQLSFRLQGQYVVAACLCWRCCGGVTAGMQPRAMHVRTCRPTITCGQPKAQQRWQPQSSGAAGQGARFSVASHVTLRYLVLARQVLQDERFAPLLAGRTTDAMYHKWARVRGKHPLGALQRGSARAAPYGRRKMKRRAGEEDGDYLEGGGGVRGRMGKRARAVSGREGEPAGHAERGGAAPGGRRRRKAAAGAAAAAFAAAASDDGESEEEGGNAPGMGRFSVLATAAAAAGSRRPLASPASAADAALATSLASNQRQPRAWDQPSGAGQQQAMAAQSAAAAAEPEEEDEGQEEEVWPEDLVPDAELHQLQQAAGAPAAPTFDASRPRGLAGSSIAAEWTPAEVTALRWGVTLHGEGNWADIAQACLPTHPDRSPPAGLAAPAPPAMKQACRVFSAFSALSHRGALSSAVARGWQRTRLMPILLRSR